VTCIKLVYKLVVQPNFVELETELVPAVERVLLIPSLKFDGAIGPKPGTLESPCMALSD